MLWRRQLEPPDPATVTRVSRVLLASEGRAIPDWAVDEAARLAKLWGASVRVFSIARIWGTSLGLPNPGLLPTKSEWAEQREIVRNTITALKERGVEANGHVLATRRPTKKIIEEARRTYCGAIVMAADPKRSWIVGDFMWSQEPYRVRREAHVPVYLVLAEGSCGETENG